MIYTIGELAKASGTTVRTLHYYDEIGLLTPESVGKNGYRYYGSEVLLRLQQILFFRELDFSLQDIKAAILSPQFDMHAALIEHRKLLTLKQKRLAKLVETIDNTITTMNNNTDQTPEELYGGFTTKELEAYKQEAKQRWGNTKAYQQSVERTKNWSNADYQRVTKESGAILETIAAHMDEGADSDIIQKEVAKYHQHMNNFYDCGIEMFRNLGDMYVADERFIAFYEKIAPGLACFLRDAIHVYAKRKAIDK